MNVSESEYQKLLRFLYLAPAALLEIDGNGSIQLMNGYASAYLMPLATDGMLRNLFELLAVADIDLAEQVAQFGEQSGIVLRDRRIRCEPRHSGDTPSEPIYYSLTVERHSGESYLVAMTDITVQVRQEERITTMIENDALQRGRVEIASGVLHDVGNAITGIGTSVSRLLGETAWAEEEGLGRLELLFQEQAQEYTAVLGEQSFGALQRYMSELRATLARRRAELGKDLESMAGTVAHISDVLTLQRRYVGEQANAPRVSMPLVQLIEDAVSMQNSALEKRRIGLRRRYQDGGAVVVGSRAGLVRVLVNLLRNAFESFDRAASAASASAASASAASAAAPTPTHDERYLVLETSLSSSHKTVLLSIRDNGAGFTVDPEQLFELGVSKKSQSAGIGLYACREILQSHNGRLWLESGGLNQGATAHIELPVQERS